MAEPARGMGRGLDAILSINPRGDGEEFRRIPVDLISPNPHQPRRRFDEDALVALSESLKQRGVLQPVLVRPVPGGRYELVAGERRWRAAQMANLEMVPALVRRHDDAASLEVALIENMARENLNPVEEARACAALVEELGLTREEVGLRVGRSRVAVSNLIRLLDLPDEALELLERGPLTEGHGRALLLAADHSHRRRLARDATRHGWSVRELERRARAAADPGEPEGADAARRSPRGRWRNLAPDQEAAIAEISDVLSRALEQDVEVRATAGGYSVELMVEGPEEALELARRLGPRAVA